MPENAGRAVRLELAACAAAAADSTGSRPLSRGSLDGLVNGQVLSDPLLVAQEDPVGGWFVESIAFAEGPYNVFPGVTSDATFIIRHLASSVMLCCETFSDPSFRLECSRFLGVALALSDTICSRAGLARGVLPVSHPGRTQIEIPNDNRLRDLRRAVTFSQDDLEKVLNRFGAGMQVITPLIVETHGFSTDTCGLDSNPLQATPIVRVESGYIVANPLGLVASIRHQVICMALDANVSDELASRLCRAAMNSTAESLERMGIATAGKAPIRPPDGILMADGLYGFDTDKVLYACVLSDDLAGYDRDVVFGMRPFLDISAALRDQFDSVATYVFSRPQPPNELLVLILVNGVGRGWSMGQSEPNRDTPYSELLLCVPELEILSHLECRKNLFLWKFALASSRLHDECEVTGFGKLNEYGCFRDHDYSFYLSDSSTPTAILFDVSWEGSLERKALDQVDGHAVLSYDNRRLAEVASYYGKREIPIYGQLATRKDRVAILVEGYSLPIWILSPEHDSEHDRNNRRLLVHLAEAIAYWLWQFTPSLANWFDGAIGSICRTFVVIIGTDEALDGPSETNSDRQPNPFDLDLLDRERFGLRITFHRAAKSLFAGATNDGEKVMMSAVLRGMSQYAVAGGRAELSDVEITTVVSAHAAQPLKKKLITMDANRDRELDPRGLPDRRTVDPCDENRLLDELGNHLIGRMRRGVGVVPSEERRELLHEVVSWYYGRLQALVQSLSPEGLIEWLVAHNEALVHDRALSRFTLATRLACFETHASICKKWNVESAVLARSTVSSRFIIEYVVACPPTGLRPICDSVYDTLLSIGAGIVNAGFESDIVASDLCDATISILPSGRLGRNFNDYESASKAFMADYADATVTTASEHFVSRLNMSSVPDKSTELIEIEAAARVEFGHSLSDLAEFWAAAGQIAYKNSPTACRIPRNDVVPMLAKELGWDEKTVDKLLADLSLKERADFLKPPLPYTKTDVYPWRFNRRYSCLRKPFLLTRGVDGFDILIGHRQLRQSWRYLVHLCLGGRLDPLTPEMKRAMSRVSKALAEAFNDRVADAMGSIEGLRVKRRVKKAGKVCTNLRPLGDIDVLAACSTKRVVYLVECKDLSLARTPREIAHMMNALIRGSQKSKSTVEKHLSRKRWAESNLKELLSWMKFGYSRKWKVEAMIVLDRRPMAAWLAVSPIQIMGLDELLCRLGN